MPAPVVALPLLARLLVAAFAAVGSGLGYGLLKLGREGDKTPPEDTQKK